MTEISGNRETMDENWIETKPGRGTSNSYPYADVTQPPRVRIGETLYNGRYEVRGYLGEGAMGAVYLCFDNFAQIEVAIKMIPPHLSANREVMADILYNFQLIQGLKHPNIAALKTLEPDPKRNNSYLLVMEYVRGNNLLESMLERKRRKQPFTLQEALPIAKQVAAALDYAHAKGIVHRDVKPGNIMLTADGSATVLDFGLAAKIRSTMASLSIPVDNSSGTPAYKSPEQWKARPARAAIDQYALAVIVYEMLSGHLPFEADSNEILRQAVLYEEPERPDGLPDPVWNALKKALSKDAAERFETCSGFVEALGRTDGSPVANAETGSPGISGSSSERKSNDGANRATGDVSAQRDIPPMEYLAYRLPDMKRYSPPSKTLRFWHIFLSFFLFLLFPLSIFCRYIDDGRSLPAMFGLMLAFWGTYGYSWLYINWKKSKVRTYVHVLLGISILLIFINLSFIIYLIQKDSSYLRRIEAIPFFGSIALFVAWMVVLFFINFVYVLTHKQRIREKTPYKWLARFLSADDGD